MTISLMRRGSELSGAATQLRVLNTKGLESFPKFSETLTRHNIPSLRPTALEIFQVNIGKMCNQVCKHCHVDAGPDRKEIMSLETLALCCDVIRRHRFLTIDITGGAPEMNPNFRWFVEQLTQARRAAIEEQPNQPTAGRVIVRSNLTILRANESYADLPQFFAANDVVVISSLPFYQKGYTDRQRGDGVFDRSIEALKMLNAVGYGVPGAGLELNLVYNPCGAFLPGDQQSLQEDYKRELYSHFGVQFNDLYTITNLPISRFLDYLIESGNLEDYMERLISSFNARAALGVMCRNTISVGWDGQLYDCDFNQMLEIPVQTQTSRHVSDFDPALLSERTIAVDQHCYGCTAGAGSSCGGSIASETA